MINNTNNSKLDQAVKQTLTNYEAPYDSTDWAKMENMLDAAPKSSNFKWSYSLVIGLVALAGFYLLFNFISSSKTSNKSIDSIPQQTIENNVITVEPITTPASPIVKSPARNSTPVISNTITAIDKKDIKSTEKVVIKENNIAKPETANTEKTKNEKESIVKERKVKDAKKQQVLKMGNEPIFGDMLDSSKGIIGKTKEKEEAKKAAKTTQPNRSIGWSSFISQNNLDSLKKYQEQQQKDSLKK